MLFTPTHCVFYFTAFYILQTGGFCFLCSWGNFECHNGSVPCINIRHHCDGIVDCEDASDEEACGSEQKRFLAVSTNTNIQQLELPLNSSDIYYRRLQTPDVTMISALAFDPGSYSLIFSDQVTRALYIHRLSSTNYTTLVKENISLVGGLAMDYRGRNIYWTDSEKRTVEVFSLSTKARAVLLKEADSPVGIALVPDTGIMFISVVGDSPAIYRLSMDGSDKMALVNTHIDQPVVVAHDREKNRVFWSDTSRRTIESVSVDGTDRSIFFFSQEILTSIAVWGQLVLWTELVSPMLFWIHRDKLEWPESRLITVDQEPSQLNLKIAIIDEHIVTPSHECTDNNGGCSHICLVVSDGKVCHCPQGTQLAVDGVNCVEVGECPEHAFQCGDGSCILREKVCDDHPDCPAGDDEEGTCAADHCNIRDYFTCGDGACIPRYWVCDYEDDCQDSSDEVGCPYTSCHPENFLCADMQKCIPHSWVCDGLYDCLDGSDEHYCADSLCDPDMTFRCTNQDYCIPLTWVCDGLPDCGDISDERNCTQLLQDLGEDDV